MGTENSRRRRRYGADLRAQILAECDAPGASIAKVAMTHGINANIVHGWRKLVRESGAAGGSDQFVPVASHVIDKGLPTTSLPAQVLVAKFLDHLPLYRQEAIFGRAGYLIARSTLAQWVGECGVQLQPLVDALAAELLRQPVLHADETPAVKL